MVMDGRRGAVAAVHILQRCIIQSLAHGRIRPSSECRSDVCDVDHFIKLTDEPRSGLWGLKDSGRQRQQQRSSSSKSSRSSPKVDTLAREKPGSVKRSNNKIPLSRMANVHFGNVCMDSLANFSSALLHQCEADSFCGEHH